MSDKNTKTICTTAVWVSTALIFAFGVFRFNWTGAIAGTFWVFVAVVLAYAATQATRAIWKYPSSEINNDVPANEKTKA